MQDQDFPSADDLKAEFNRRKERYQHDFMQNGTAGAIEALSRAIRDLRDIGVNVQLQLHEAVPEEVFSLIKTVGSAHEGTSVSISGLLKIDQDDHLLCISVKEKGAATLKIYLSDRLYASKQLQGDFRGECFDLNGDAEAIREFQKHVLTSAAQNEIIRKHDVTGSLGFDERRVAKLPKNKLD